MSTLLRVLVAAGIGAVVAPRIPHGEDDHMRATPLDAPIDGNSRVVVATASSLAPWATAALGAGCGGLVHRALHAPRPATLAVASSVTALSLAFRRVGVIVGRNGVRLTCGLPGVVVTLPMAQVRSARAVTVTAAEFGGVGLRWSPRRGVALLLRSGPGLTLELPWGPLTLTVDEPESAAALIEAYVQKRRL